MVASLPIRDVLPVILRSLNCNSSVIIQAPPGSGKTTVVPLELLRSPFLGNKKIVMLEPRRLAATNAARWMASQLGESPGRTVGYSIRFDSRISSSTRIEIVTEGILNRRLQTDPLLEEVGIIIFDEFHERNLNSDVALALCYDLQQGLRPDLKLVVMSATFDPGTVSKLLDDAPVISCGGTSHPVSVRYAGDHPPDRIADAVAATVRKALNETEGDILVFLPGGREIRACERILRSLFTAGIPLVVPLYGDLPFAAQERAILPADVRKVVLATNIAETSLTIEGVGVVIDSGWVRQVTFDPAAGLARMQTVRASAASADQRKGRAGRLGPGTCYRLWSEHTQRGLVPFSLPEILIADLSQLALDLAAWGVREPEQLRWLDPPRPNSLDAARRLLQDFGALDSDGYVTPYGREMAEYPLHPRLSHIILQGRLRQIEGIAVDLAALLSVRDIIPRAFQRNETTRSDIIDRLNNLWEWRRSGQDRSQRFDTAACREVDRATRQLWKDSCASNNGSVADVDEAVSFLLVSAFPDRLAQRRESSPDRYLLGNGRGAVLSTVSGVHSADYLLAVAVDGGDGGDGVIHLAHSVDLALIRRNFASRVETVRHVFWDRELGRTVVRREERFLSLVLSSHPVAPMAEELIQGAVEAVRVLGLGILRWPSEAQQFRNRVLFLRRQFPDGEWPDFSDQGLLDSLETWFKPWLMEANLGDLAKFDVLSPLHACLSFEQKRKLSEGAPTHLTVPSGSRIGLEYGEKGPPVLAVKLQEMFGLSDTPCVAWGTVPVLLHLLSPAKRPLQVTQDLKSFWDSTYNEVKKDLKGRYPKHPWPEDPWNALPTGRTTKRGGGR